MTFLSRLLPRPRRLVLAPATTADVPDIGRILSDWVDETDWMPRLHSRAEEQGFARTMVARGWVTVARRGGRVLGFVALKGEEVIALYVAAGARGQGVGRALIGALQRRARRIELWAHEANGGARRFYRAQGFVEVGRSDGTDTDEGLPAIHLVWESPGEPR